MTTDQTNMPAAEPTLEQKMQANIERADRLSDEIGSIEVRVYKTKTHRQLLNGEIREYVLEHRYVPKKKTGPCKTELIKQQTKLRAEVKALLHELSIPQLHDIKIMCDQWAASNNPSAQVSPA